MSPFTPAKAQRIAGMFVTGYSLDMISEIGVVDGWTREDAKQVVAEHDWSLTWDGRLTPASQRRAAFDAVPYKSPIAEPSLIEEADAERMIQTGLDHPVLRVRQAAVKAQAAVEALRRVLILQEEKDAEEVARRRREEAEHAAELADPSNWPHGTWGGYKRHKLYGVPACDECQQAADEYVEEASSSKRTTPKCWREPLSEDVA